MPVCGGFPQQPRNVGALEQRCLPATWQEAGHERSAGVGAQGDRLPSAPCATGRHKQPPSPGCASPRGPQPGTAGQSATIPTQSAQSLPPKPALHGNPAAEGRSRHDAHPSHPSAASPGPQPRPRIRPKNDRCCQPPAWSQAGASPRGTPPPHPGAGLGNRGLEMRDFPTAQPGLGALPHGLCTQADRRDPGQETQDALWAQDGAPCPAPSRLHRAGQGTPSEQLCKTQPLKHTKAHPEGQGLGSSTCSPLQGPWTSPGPRSCPPNACPTPCREEIGSRGCPAPSQALLDDGSGGVCWGRQSLCSHVSRAPHSLCQPGFPRPCPPTPRPPAGARVNARGSWTYGPNAPLDPAQGQLGAGSSSLRAAAPGLLWPHGLWSRPKLAIRRDHRERPTGFPWPPSTTRHRLGPHPPAPPPGRQLPAALESPRGTAAKPPQERPNSWPSSLPPPPRTAHSLTCPQCQPRHAGQAGLPALPRGEEGQTRGLAEPRGQPWPRPHVDEDRPAPGERPCPCRPAPRPGVSQDAMLALDTH